MIWLVTAVLIDSAVTAAVGWALNRRAAQAVTDATDAMKAEVDAAITKASGQIVAQVVGAAKNLAPMLGQIVSNHISATGHVDVRPEGADQPHLRKVDQQ